MDRDFLLKDDNVEITSMDIASHGSFLVAGSSSGMILLFDLSNPSAQTDGLLIGQIRARGMHTNLIVTVKFSEDGRFVFAGVSKGSSEMLAIDLGKVLVDWNAANAAVVNRGSSDALQQLQLSSMVTFSFSDAKLRGFGAVVRMDAPCSSKNGGTSTSFRDSSALYRLACGKGIKNVHIWHFRVGYLEGAGNGAGASDLQAAEHKQLHGKWEYVCDVASNGNTITHIEFRQSGNELLSKSAGMCIRLWDLQSNSCSRLTEEAAGAVDANKDGEAFAVNDAVTPAEDSGAPVAAAAPVTGYVMLKPSYVDIANSQDVKCMLPIGTGAYGGTYQFAVLNTAAPREANRDVLELPERFSGDAAVVSGIAGGGNSATQAPASSAASAFLPAGRGRRITREIEQVICTDEGKHAIILCADGGVVYYNVPLSSNNAAGVARKHAAADGGSSSDEQDGSAGAGNSSSSGSGAGQLVELGALFRVKDQQQHPGSWALRRVGRQGMVVLLRATTSSTTSGAQSSRSGVTVEVRQLAGEACSVCYPQFLRNCASSLSFAALDLVGDCVFASFTAHVSGDAADWVAPTASVGTSADAQQEQQALSLCYYQDSSAMEAQKALRRTWVLPANSSALSSKRQNIGSAGSAGAGSGAKRSKQSSNNTPAAAILEALSTANTDSVPRKRKALSIQDGEYKLFSSFVIIVAFCSLTGSTASAQTTDPRAGPDPPLRPVLGGAAARLAERTQMVAATSTSPPPPSRPAAPATTASPPLTMPTGWPAAATYTTPLATAVACHPQCRHAPVCRIRAASAESAVGNKWAHLPLPLQAPLPPHWPGCALCGTTTKAPTAPLRWTNLTKQTLTPPPAGEKLSRKDQGSVSLVHT